MSEPQADAGLPFGEAGNPLEQALLDWTGGDVEDRKFLEAFLNSPVGFFGQEVEGGQGVRLLMMRGEDGPWMPVFTSRERARPFAGSAEGAEDFPRTLIQAHSAELVLHLGEQPPSLVLNPGWEHGIVLPPAMVASMRQAVLDQQGPEKPGIITP